ncbi:MAG: hypothetical protein R3C24_14355 [Cyanobacteriota/Melainabacteria group bacterium]
MRLSLNQVIDESTTSQTDHEQGKSQGGGKSACADQPDEQSLPDDFVKQGTETGDEK